MQQNPYIIPLIIGAIPIYYLMLISWKHRSELISRLFLLVVVAILWLSFTSILELLSTTLQWKLFCLNLEYISFVSIPALWAAFIVTYTGKGHWISRYHTLFISSTLFVLLLLIWTDSYHHLAWSHIQLIEYRSLVFLDVGYGLINLILIGLNYLLSILAILVALNYWRRRSGIFRAQASLILLSSLAPTIVGLEDVFFPTTPVDWLNMAYVLACIPAGYALFRYKLLEIIPKAHTQVFKSISDAVIVLDIHNHIVDVNPAAIQLMGKSTSAIIGNRLSQLFPEAIDTLHQYEHTLTVQEEITIKVNEHIQHFDLRISPLQGNNGEFSGRVILMQNISSRKKAEELLKQSEERFFKSFQANPAGILLILLEEDICTEINESALQILEYTVAEINNTPFSESPIWTNSEDWNRLVIQVQKKGLMRNLESKLKAKSGSVRHVLISADTIIINNHEQLIIQMNDITDRKRAERKTIELALEREKVQILQNFINDTSHDLRTPITSLLNSTYLLTKYADRLNTNDNHSQTNNQHPQSESATSKTITLIKKHAGITKETTQRLHHLVENIYEMVRLDAQNHLNPVVTNLNSLIDKTVHSIRPLAAKKSILITFVPDHHLPQLLIDPFEFPRVLENLLNNSIQYTPENGKIDLKTRQENGHVLIEVTDTGIGMSSEDLPYVFDRFYRTDLSRSTRTGGTGLGLAIVKKIVEAHQASIEVTSELHKGTTFTIRLPAPSQPASQIH